ncbi:MAG: hypothetical protein IGR93_06410 [Hydrococcus sp. C42_A2020_068]|uniref:hypothetical protein n=1 Tax=Pleurocapsa sp. PCC 7327 TaxID=118163 RepID=UPI00029FBA16|nr:hypothetical protein [Pleurocapsa sp. PCC 7327]AFY78125.1 hypothetical protein Ple7327_2871 [Pleurocapsa sp. PCC 7327]MBF2019733.1 hypothetical protein [Hydrococcus sp. C42_A2020_068]
MKNFKITAIETQGTSNMEMSWLDFALITLFNATLCILLPRLVTLNWSFGQQENKQLNIKRSQIVH